MDVDEGFQMIRVLFPQEELNVVWRRDTINAKTDSGSKGSTMKPKIATTLSWVSICLLFLLLGRAFVDGGLAHHFRGTIYHLLAYCLLYLAVIKLVKRKMDQYAKYLWLFLLSFCFLYLLLIKLIIARSFERFVFQLDAPIYLFIFSLLYLGIVKLVRKKLDQYTNHSTIFSKYVWLFVVSAFLSVTLSLSLSIAIESLIFGKSHRQYDYVVTWLFYLTFFASVGNSYISYLYLVDLNQARENLHLARKAQAEAQLRLLQQKVDPHFLFNNLNVLSSLVERNPAAASEFVTHFTRLYRYVLQHLDAEIVPLDEELTFARNYIYLVEQRFGLAYCFEVSLGAEQAREHMIIPTALQGLIENAIKHNEGSARLPLPIKIAMDGDYLTVSNQLRPKSAASDSAGTGLENLQARYRLLTDKPVEVSREAESFAVKVPLLKVVNA
jgi:two-component system, LytTR family, sensor kinase